MQLGLSAARPGVGTLGGVVPVKSLSAVLAEEAAAAQARQPVGNEPLISSLAELIRSHWRLAKQAKEPIEREMLSAVRARRGEYDPDKLASIRRQGGSEIYMMLFANKARQLKALLYDVLVGSGSEKPWTLEPTPSPELPPSEVSQIVQAVYEETVQAEMMGVPVSLDDVRRRMLDMKAAVENRIDEQARAEAKRAEREIEDIMVEGGWLEAIDAFIDDLAVFKTAILKGPVVRMSNELKWVPGPDGTVQPRVTRAPKVHFDRVDPFNVYPAPWATSVHDAFLIERHKLSRSALNALIGVEGYSEAAIRKVLEEHGAGGLHEWLSVDTERAEAEGRGLNGTQGRASDLIDALQYWGSVSGKLLREWGMDEAEVPDESKEYEVEAWLVGNHVIKAVLNPDPLSRRPYYADGFSRVPGAFWHTSLFDMMRDCQDMCNSAARALANNLGIASGPQVVVNVDRLPQGEEITEMYPWKLWQTTNDPLGGSGGRPVDFFQPSSNAAELMGVFERFAALADEVSGIPRYMAGFSGGEGGAGRTASGLSMMVSNATKQVRQVMASLDVHIIAPSVERTYHWILVNKPELRLSGDLAAQARGSLSLITKETAQVRTNEFLAATANPIDLQIIGLDGRAELLRHAVKRLDVNPDRVVPSASKIKQQQAMAQMQQMALMQQQATMQGQGEQAPGGSGQELMDGTPTTDNFSPQGANA